MRLIASLNRLSLKYFDKAVSYDEKKNNLTLKEYFKRYKTPYVISNFNNFSLEELDEVVEIVKKQKITKSDLINTFYRKLKKVLDSSREKLLLDQIIHYLTTYGNFGYDNKANMYHSNKNLNKEDEEKIKELMKDIKVINTISVSEAIEKLKEIAKKDIALDSNDIKDIANIIYHYKIDINTRNRELQYYLNLINKTMNFEDIGRTINHVFTGIPLFIKTKKLKEREYYFTSRDIVLKNTSISKLLDIDGIEKDLYTVLKESFLSLDNKTLAQRFNRDKMIFMTIKDIFKNEENIRKKINKVSKLSKRYHKPVKKTDELISDNISVDEFKEIIRNKKSVELVKIANAIKMRLNAIEMGYKEEFPLFVVIRNGKKYFTMTKTPNKKNLKEKFKLIKKHLRKRIVSKMKEHNIAIKKDKYIELAIPFSQKKFVYKFPVGSKISFPKKNFVIGISWKGEKVDFDLSVISQFGKVGWNAFFKNDGIFFSGDITSAPFGATELIWVKNPEKMESIYKVNVHLFNSLKDEESFKFFAGITDKLKKKDFKKPVEKILSPENIIFAETFKLKKRESIELGVLLKNEFYFVNFAGKTGVTNRMKKEESDALMIYIKSFIKFDEILKEEDYKHKEDAKTIISNSPDLNLLLKLVS